VAVAEPHVPDHRQEETEYREHDHPDIDPSLLSVGVRLLLASLRGHETVDDTVVHDVVALQRRGVVTQVAAIEDEAH